MNNKLFIRLKGDRPVYQETSEACYEHRIFKPIRGIFSGVVDAKLNNRIISLYIDELIDIRLSWWKKR